MQPIGDTTLGPCTVPQLQTDKATIVAPITTYTAIDIGDRHGDDATVVRTAQVATCEDVKGGKYECAGGTGAGTVVLLVNKELATTDCVPPVFSSRKCIG